jgi:hypothetical protein
MVRIGAFVFLLWVSFSAWSQGKNPSDSLKKGSYLYYGQPAVEDNSFLLEEAFNQSPGAVQHITTAYWDRFNRSNLIMGFSQEIPLGNIRHQFSYTVYFDVLQPDTLAANSFAGKNITGVGDLYLSHRFLLMGAEDWAMVIPRFTLILPTGKAIDGLGSGGFGAQFNLAVTKRLSRRLVSHFNAGYTYIIRADRYGYNVAGVKFLAYEKNLDYKNIGTSLVWYPRPKFNLMMECVYNFDPEIGESGSIIQHIQTTINPGFRNAIDIGRVQIVPGLSVPISFEDGSFKQTGLFLYLSFESDRSKPRRQARP